MANDMNQCNFTGRLGKDPDIRQAANSKVANFSIAVGEQWKDRQTGEKKEKTTWVNVVIWGALADTVERFMVKGTFIRVSGKLQTRQYEQDGQTRYATELVANDLQILGGWKGEQNGGGSGGSGTGRTGSSGGGQQQPPRPQQQGNPPQGGMDFDDDIPF